MLILFFLRGIRKTKRDIETYCYMLLWYHFQLSFSHTLIFFKHRILRTNKLQKPRTFLLLRHDVSQCCFYFLSTATQL